MSMIFLILPLGALLIQDRPLPAAPPDVAERLAIVENDLRLLENKLAALEEALRQQAQKLGEGREQRQRDRAAQLIGRTLSLSGIPATGAANAPIVVIEYSDFACPFCAQFHRETFPVVEREEILTGRVRYAFSATPLDTTDRTRLYAAAAGECAQEQGRFWGFLASMFGHPGPLAAKSVDEVAARAGVEASQYRACIEGAGLERAQRLGDSGRALGILGTPTFLLALPLGDNSVRVVDAFSGALPYEMFSQKLKAVQASVGQNVR